MLHRTSSKLVAWAFTRRYKGISLLFDCLGSKFQEKFVGKKRRIIKNQERLFSSIDQITLTSFTFSQVLPIWRFNDVVGIYFQNEFFVCFRHVFQMQILDTSRYLKKNQERFLFNTNLFTKNSSHFAVDIKDSEIGAHFRALIFRKTNKIPSFLANQAIS